MTGSRWRACVRGRANLWSAMCDADTITDSTTPPWLVVIHKRQYTLPGSHTCHRKRSLNMIKHIHFYKYLSNMCNKKISMSPKVPIWRNFYYWYARILCHPLKYSFLRFSEYFVYPTSQKTTCSRITSENVNGVIPHHLQHFSNLIDKQQHTGFKRFNFSM